MIRNETTSTIFLLSSLVLTAYGCFKLGQSLSTSDLKRTKADRKNEIAYTKDTQKESAAIYMEPIGHISSIYRLCVGTPRQGLLSPSSRGIIELLPNRIASDSILELEKFSHVWIVFVFHLNSNTRKVEESKQSHKLFPSKIAPPALGGKRVGVFATRSPHRPNPIGFTLCKIDKVLIPSKRKHKNLNNAPYQIYISGLDLVDGTPVLDIKPYVPHYDSIGYEPSTLVSDVSLPVQTPEWVSEGLGKRRSVSFSNEARNDLRKIIYDDQAGKRLDFFGVHTGRDSSNDDAFINLQNCIVEVLRVDVRSRWQTDKARKGKFHAERAIRVKTLVRKSTETDDNDDIDTNCFKTDDHFTKQSICTQQIDRLLIKYIVKSDDIGINAGAVDTIGSGADDEVQILKIDFIS